MNLLLECKNMTDTAINWILHPSQGFIWHGYSSFTPAVQREVQKQLGDVACSEHLVNCCKMVSCLLITEVRRENAFVGAPSSQELACPARRTSRSCHFLFFFLCNSCYIFAFPCAYPTKNPTLFYNHFLKGSGVSLVMSERTFSLLVKSKFL